MKKGKTALHILCNKTVKVRSSVSKKATGKRRNKKDDEILESGLRETIFCCKPFLSYPSYGPK